MEFDQSVAGRWKVSVVLSAVLAVLVFTPAGLYLFGFAVALVGLALVAGILLFSVLSFAAGEEKRRYSLAGVAVIGAVVLYIVIPIVFGAPAST